jgi:hypothetical protein
MFCMLCLDHICQMLLMEVLYVFFVSVMRAACLSHVILMDLIILIIFSKDYKLLLSIFCSLLLHLPWVQMKLVVVRNNLYKWREELECLPFTGTYNVHCSSVCKLLECFMYSTIFTLLFDGLPLRIVFICQRCVCVNTSVHTEQSSLGLQWYKTSIKHSVCPLNIRLPIYGLKG